MTMNTEDRIKLEKEVKEQIDKDLKTRKLNCLVSAKKMLDRLEKDIEYQKKLYNTMLEAPDKHFENGFYNPLIKSRVCESECNTVC